MHVYQLLNHVEAPKDLDHALYMQQSTFTFSGKKMLHLQENVALARKCCICKKITQWEDFLSKTVAVQGCVTTLQRAVCFPTKLTGKNLAFARKCCIGKKCCICKIFLSINLALARKCCIGKIFLSINLALARKCCICKIFLSMQHFLANATFSCH